MSSPAAPAVPHSPSAFLGPYLKEQARPLAIGVLLVCITNALQLSVPYLSKRAIDAMQASSFSHARQFAYLILIVALVQAVVRVFSRTYLLDAGRQVEFRVRNDLFAHLTRLTPSFYEKAGVGDVMSRCVNDLGNLRLLIGPGLLMLVNAVAAYAVALPVMWRLEPHLTLIALGPYLPLLFLLQWQAKRMFGRMRAVQDELGTLSSRIQENLAGQLTVKAYGREESEVAAFSSQNEVYYRANLGLAKARAQIGILFGVLSGIGTTAVLGLGGYAVIRGGLTLGGYAAFSGYLAELSVRTNMLGMIFAAWQRGRAALSRVDELFIARPDFVDPHPAETPSLRGELEVRDLTVTYTLPEGASERTRRVLDGISFDLSPGRSLAVVGKTGAGKTTLLLALARLIDVPEGAVRYDGRDLTDWPLRGLRQQLGFVPQEPFLFSATLRDNIAFGRPNASETAVREAVEAARLSADLAALPEGLQTEVGERGVTLSGGQRTRAALARALIVDPHLLLLDDPFANVDADTARALWDELQARFQDRTRILVTHRLSLAMACDEILLLENGRVGERGQHEELLRRRGPYATLFQRERLEEELRSQVVEPLKEAS
jgi:ATP-binding cassette, subfamily B, multidrug efflux pump